MKCVIYRFGYLGRNREIIVEATSKCLNIRLLNNFELFMYQNNIFEEFSGKVYSSFPAIIRTKESGECNVVIDSKGLNKELQGLLAIKAKLIE